MRAKVDATKAASTNIEEMMRALKGAARGQKQRGTRQSHQRDWLQTNADLQRQRAEAETARSLWLQAESERSAAEAVGAPLRDLAQAEDAAAAARREWSVEMRSQLRDLRELCAASAVQQRQTHRPTAAASGAPAAAPSSSRPASATTPASLGRSLLTEVSRSLAVQADRLAATAAALERELIVHTAAIFAEDPAAGAVGGNSSSSALGSLGGSGMSDEAVEALFASKLYAAGAVATPHGQPRSAAERRLLEALGMQLKSEAEAHREHLGALRAEFSDAFDAAGTPGGRNDEDEDEAAAAAEGAEEVPGDEAVPADKPANGNDAGLRVAGDYFVLEDPNDKGSSGRGHGTGVAAGLSPPQPPPLPADSTTAAAAGGSVPAGGPSPVPPGCTSSAAPTAACGWNAAAQARLAKLEGEFRGRPRHALLARLRLELPAFSGELLEARLHTLCRRHAYRKRRRALLLAWEARQQALGRSARHLLYQLAAEEGRLQLQRAEREALDARREELHAELAVLEAARLQREQEEAERAAAEVEIAEALAEARHVKAEAERAHKKALVAEYHAQQAEHRCAEEQHKMEEATRLQAELLARAEYNLSRVQYRAELHAERERLRAEQAEHERLLGEEQALRRQQEREARIAALTADRQEDDVYKPTAASQAEALPCTDLFPLYGYADATLMKDVRFKIGHALRNAGLHGTDYARQILCDHARFGGSRRPDAVVSNVPFGPG